MVERQLVIVEHLLHEIVIDHFERIALEELVRNEIFDLKGRVALVDFVVHPQKKVDGLDLPVANFLRVVNHVRDVQLHEGALVGLDQLEEGDQVLAVVPVRVDQLARGVDAPVFDALVRTRVRKRKLKSPFFGFFRLQRVDRL